MAGETIELLVKTILEADPSNQLAAIEKVDAAIQKLGGDAAKISSGSGGNYSKIVDQAAQFETHIKSAVEFLRTANINPAVIAELEKLRTAAPAIVTQNIANPVTRESVGARIEAQVAGVSTSDPQYQTALKALTSAARKQTEQYGSSSAAEGDLRAADVSLAQARENFAAVINRQAAESRVQLTDKAVIAATPAEAAGQVEVASRSLNDTLARQEQAANPESLQTEVKAAEVSLLKARQHLAYVLNQEAETAPELYHGTTSSLLPGIKEKGLLLSGNAAAGEPVASFASADPITAYAYAQSKANKYGGEPVVIKFPTPPDTTTNTILNPKANTPVRYSEISTPIPPEQISVVSSGEELDRVFEERIQKEQQAGLAAGRYKSVIEQLAEAIEQKRIPSERSAATSAEDLAAAQTAAEETYFHGTTSNRLPSIQEQGLIPGAFGAVHATPNYESALAFARDTAQREGGTPSVVAFRNPGTDEFHAGVPANQLTTVDVQAKDKAEALRSADERLLAQATRRTEAEDLAAADKRENIKRLEAQTNENATAIAEDTKVVKESTSARRTRLRQEEVAQVQQGPDNLAFLAGNKDPFEAAKEFYVAQAGGAGGGKPPRITPPPPPPEEPPDGETPEQKAARQRLRAAELRRARVKEQQAQDDAKNAAETSIENQAALDAQKAQDLEVKIARAKQVQEVVERARNAAPPGAPSQLSEPVLSAFSEKVVTANEQAGVQERLAADAGYTESVSRVRLALQQQSAAIEQQLLTLRGMNDEEGAYSKALADTRIAQARTNADVNILLNASTEYAASLADNKSAQRQVKAKTEQLLAADDDYISATAEIANARRTIGARSKLQELQGVGFESTTATGVAFADKGIGITDAERERRRAVGVQQITELEGATKATAEYRKLQTELAEATQRQLINVKAQSTPGASTESALITQRRTIEAALNAQLERQLATSPEYQAAAVDLATATKLRAAQEKADLEKNLSVNQEYILATAEAANARRLQAEQIKARELEGVGFGGPGLVLSDGTKIQATAAAQEADLQAYRELAAANLHNAELARARIQIEQQKLSYSESEAAELAQASLGQKQYNETQRLQIAAAQRALYEQRVASGGKPGPNLLEGQIGTTFQRIQASLANRNGNFRDPTEFAQLGQFLQSKFLTTAGFAVSGVATYAVFNGLQKLVTDSAALEKILAQVRAEFSALGEGNNFSGFRNGILQISRDTGAAAADVAKLALQFKGAFATQSNAQILTQVRSAVELARVTGISLDEITNNLTGTAVTYGTTVQHVGDAVLTLQDRTGVAAKESIQALSDMAVTAQDAGLTVEQALSIATVASKYTGQSGASVAEGLNRVLPAIGTKAAQIVALFQQAQPGNLGKVSDALASGETGKVFDLLGRGYAELSRSQKNYLISLLGSRRDAKTVIDVFQHYGEVLNDVSAAQNSNGRLAKSYADLQQTLGQQVSRVAAAFKTIGAELLSLGLSDIVQTLAKAIGLLVSQVSSIIGFFAKLNSGLDGIPAKLIAIAAAIKLVGALAPTLEAAGVGGLLSKALPGSTGGAGRILTPFERSQAAAKAEETAAVTRSGLLPFANPFTSKGSALGISKLGSTIEDAAGKTEGVINTVGTKVGSALQNFGTVLESLTPILAILFVTASIENIVSGFSNTRKKLNDLATSAAQEGGFSTTAGAADLSKYADAQNKALHPGLSDLSFNPLTNFKTLGGQFGALFSKSASARGADVVQQTTTQAFATVLKKSFTSDQLRQLLAQSNSDISPTGGLGSAAFDRSRLSEKDLADIAKNGTVDDKQFKSVIDLFTKAAADKKGLGQAYQKIIDGNKAHAQDVSNLKTGLADLPILQIEQQTGTITSEAFLTQSTSLIETTTRLLKAAIAANADPQYIQGLKQSLDQETSARSAVLTQRIKDITDQATAAASITGASPQRTSSLTLAAGLAALRLPGAASDPNAPQLAQTLVKAQQDQLQFMADHASSAAEAQRILDEGLKIPPEVQTVLGLQQLHALPENITNTLQHAAAEVNLDFNKALEEIAAAKGGIKAGIEGFIGTLSKQIDVLTSEGKGDSVQVRRLEENRRKLQQFLASGVFNAPDTVHVAGPAPATRQQLQDAQAAYDKATAGSDQFAQLRVDQETALQGVQAVSGRGGNRADKLNAAAKLVQAEIALKQYLADHASSTAEAARILATPIAFGPELQSLQLQSKLPPDSAKALQESARGLGVSYDNVLKDLIAAKGGIQAGVEALVVRLSAMLRNLVRLGAGTGKKATEIRAALADLEANQGDIGSIKITNPNVTVPKPVSTLAQNQDAYYGLLASTTQDPVQQAKIAQAKAQNDYQQAKATGTKADQLSALAAINTANQQFQSAVEGVSEAQFAVLQALADGDPVKVAQVALAQAQFQAAHAHSQAEALQAQAAEISAEHQLRDAIFAIMDAQSALLIAIDNAAGDTVKAARDGLQHAKDVLARDLASGKDANSAQVINDRAAIVQAQAALRDTSLQQSEDEINFLLNTHKIFASQAIARLKVLDANQNLTTAQHHQIEEQIYNLQHQANQDLQFNLPTDINLPTLYEARRFDGSGGGAGGSHYQDNRRITVTITTNAKVDPKEVLSIVSDSVSAPPRYGTRVGTY
jgi:hypothetical protein